MYEDNEIQDDSAREIKEEIGIVGNIPIMMLTCDNLKDSIQKMKKKQDKCDIVIKHYKYCYKCEITNNNDRELNMTLNEIKKKEIDFVDSKHLASVRREVLECYFNLQRFPTEQKDVNELFVKMYYLVDEPNYLNDILIIFSSNIIEI